MLKKLTVLVISFAALATATLGVAPLAMAECTSATDCVTQGASKASGETSNTTNDVGTVIRNIVNLLLFIVGAVGVVMIVVGALKYVLSNGDANAVKGAKDTIFYAAIGVAVALLAYAVINFVITSIKK